MSCSNGDCGKCQGKMCTANQAFCPPANVCNKVGNDFMCQPV